MSKTATEISYAARLLATAADLAATPAAAAALPPDGVEAAVVGCGTSWFVAQAYAAAREAAGHGRTDAFAASEFPRTRAYPWVVAISRSGTTSEVEALLASLPRAQRVGAASPRSADSPCAIAAAPVIVLDFADEESVVQTRFATTALALLRASLGDDVRAAASDAEAALAAALPLEPGTVDADHLPRHWLDRRPRQRGGAQVPRGGPALDRVLPGHGVPPRPDQHRRAAAGPSGPSGRLPPGLAEQIHATGATLVDTGGLDPMAALDPGAALRGRRGRATAASIPTGRAASPARSILPSHGGAAMSAARLYRPATAWRCPMNRTRTVARGDGRLRRRRRPARRAAARRLRQQQPDVERERLARHRRRRRDDHALARLHRRRAHGDRRRRSRTSTPPTRASRCKAVFAGNNDYALTEAADGAGRRQGARHRLPVRLVDGQPRQARRKVVDLTSRVNDPAFNWNDFFPAERLAATVERQGASACPRSSTTWPSSTTRSCSTRPAWPTRRPTGPGPTSAAPRRS